ncbi:unnamed protein product [Allacma fusca]|uniref:Arginase n=1 Tax=Allacma fusca TaxID=39272 RepID=A0A8J2LJG5_9HEXA|nr:unnamed protein product [Allacma fusca]
MTLGSLVHVTGEPRGALKVGVQSIPFGKGQKYIALRNVQELERTAIEMTGVHAFSTKEVSDLGIEKVVEIALELICPVPGGLTLREGLTVVEKVRQMGNLVSMDLVEVNPLIGTEEDVKRAANVSMRLLLSAFGYYRGGVSTKPFPIP